MSLLSSFSFAFSIFLLLNFSFDFALGCCCCDCCCCCNQQQTMNINGTTIPMGGGCGCGGGSSDSALLALLLGRRRRRSANLGINTLQMQKGINAGKMAAGCEKCVNCEGKKGATEKVKRGQFLSISAPAPEREMHQQHFHQQTNPRFLAIPHSQLKIKRKF